MYRRTRLKFLKSYFVSRVNYEKELSKIRSVHMLYPGRFILIKSVLYYFSLFSISTNYLRNLGKQSSGWWALKMAEANPEICEPGELIGEDNLTQSLNQSNSTGQESRKSSEYLSEGRSEVSITGKCVPSAIAIERVWTGVDGGCGWVVVVGKILAKTCARWSKLAKVPA